MNTLSVVVVVNRRCQLSVVVSYRIGRAWSSLKLNGVCVCVCVWGLVAANNTCMTEADLVRVKHLLELMFVGGMMIDSSGQLINATRWDYETAIFVSIELLATVGRSGTQQQTQHRARATSYPQSDLLLQSISFPEYTLLC